MISASAHEQVRRTLPFAFNDLGVQQLKNLDEPLRLFLVEQEGSDKLGMTSPSDARSGTRASSLLAEKPSIAVLPFQNMSGDPEQEYFADGVVEDITTALSRKRELLVIARNSTFAYKGKPTDIRQVGHELGVRYVLEGSVRKSGGRVRITGQLIEAATGTHIWADKYDGALEDIFDLQDKVTSDVVGAILPELERAEIGRVRRKPTDSLEAYDYYIRALDRHYEFTREANLEALRLAETAARIDPSFALAYAIGATALVQKISFGWSTDLLKERADARRLFDKAIELDRNHPLILAMLGQARALVLRETGDALALLKQAIALDPNLASARYWCGWALLHVGRREEEAIEQFKTALRLSPLDSRIFLAQTGLAYALFFLDRFEEGLTWATQAVRQQQNYPAGHRAMCINLARLDRLDEARAAGLQALKLVPGWSISRISREIPWQRPFDLERLSQAFRLAGIPE